ncbi:CDP-alcohol phosphatidyltransferase family protein, partial [Campylobacter avium]
MNLPNALALMRIVLAPILFFLLTYKIDDIHPSWIDYFATVVFSIAALSDFFDGYIARIWG